ncbi:hypothetical protein CDIK_1936 [Cucumispora dikerogammari]|nr:hypothetical protein CDIK_1936 [Cucumispora dikerogammari]
MKLSSHFLKIFYFDLIHILCISLLFHSCSIKNKNSFNDYVFSISSVKNLIHKNKAKRTCIENRNESLSLSVLKKKGIGFHVTHFYNIFFDNIKEIAFELENDRLIVIQNKRNVIREFN